MIINCRIILEIINRAQRHLGITNMDDVKLEQANGLQKNITIAKENLTAWENSNGFVNSGGPHIQWRKENGDYRNGTVPATSETFGVVKAINIIHWQGIVAQLEKEYSEL